MAKIFRENIEIVSSATGGSGLKLTNLPAGTDQGTFSGVLGVTATGDVVKIAQSSLRPVTVAAVAPATPTSGQQWLDTSVTPSELKIYNGTAWEPANDEVQHYTNLAAFPAVGTEGVIYIADDTDVVYVYDVTAPAYVNVPSTATGLFSIGDGTTTQAINVGNTITFTEASTTSSILWLSVSATDTVTLDFNLTTTTTGQVPTYDGTNVVWSNPSTSRYSNTWTPVANTQTVHTHALAAGTEIIVQVRDTVTSEVVDVEIEIISATTFGVTSTTTDSLSVVAL